MKLVIIFAAFIVAISALSDHEHWTEFKTKHSKNYSLVEDKIRFQIFQDNLRKIEVHNAKYEKGEVSYFFKVTKFADWTSEEFKNILKAQFGDRPTANTFKPKPNFTAPVSLDWRDSNAVSEVKDQGVCGACWAFSVTGTIESQLILKKNQRSSLSEQELVDCDDKLYGCNGGDTALAYVYVQSNGLYSEEQYPYTAKDGTCRQVDGDKPIKTLSGYEFVDTDEDLVAEAIASVGPVSIAVEANSDWQLYGGGIFDHSDCGDDVNHAVLGVGYTTEYWIIKNSWSESWGENGYIRLVRGKSQCGVAEYVSYVIL